MQGTEMFLLAERQDHSSFANAMTIELSILDEPTPDPRRPDLRGREETAERRTRETLSRTRRVGGAGVSSSSDDPSWLLQQRIRAAAIVLVVGFGAAFVRSLFLHPLSSLFIRLQSGVLIVLVSALLALSTHWRPSVRLLRIFETALFTMVVAFFLAAEYSLILKGVRSGDPTRAMGPIRSSVHWILTTIFTYAIFIPNTWRRAALVITPMIVAPVIVPWVLALFHPEFFNVALQIVDLERSSENALFLILGAFTAIFGTHTINSLRAQVHEARQLNQYRLGKRLGRGGMGEVFLAEHQLLKRPCAIKLIRADMVANPRVFARFEREVRAAARLSHPNTIEIFDYGQDHDGSFYYVMEYLPGMSLAELVDRHGPLEPGRVVYLLLQACDALSEAHDAGLIHRDIKPANLMASHRGGRFDVVKLLDFGLVKTVAEEGAPALSREGTVVGSPLYMAPEQIVRLSPPDQRTDIYSLGAVAYYLLTGRPPFPLDDSMAVMIAHTRDPVPPPRSIRPNLPEDLEQVVLKCLAKLADDRYGTAAELAQALAACRCASDWSSARAKAWWSAHINELALDPCTAPTTEQPAAWNDEPTPKVQSQSLLVQAAHIEHQPQSVPSQ